MVRSSGQFWCIYIGAKKQLGTDLHSVGVFWSWYRMYIHEALDIVESRFLTNLPDSELQHADRLFFQIEQAHWFYEDFIADNNDNLPHFTLKQFATKMFAHSDMFRKMQDKCMSLFNDFSAYRKKIPVFGCCILNPEMTKVALQCSWNGKSWSWPKGKVNEGEDAYKCAIRETFEETGFDASYHCDEEHFIAHYEDQKLIKLYLGLLFNTTYFFIFIDIFRHPLL